MFAGTGYEQLIYQLDLTEAYYALLKGDRAKCHEKLRTGLERSRYDLSKRTLRMHPMMLSKLFAEALAAQIEVDYVKQSIRSLHLRPPSRDVKNGPWPLRVYTFGQFEVLRDGRPLEYSRKAPRKTIALLKAIIAFGGTNVREQRLVDAFWSDEEGDVATRSLGAALHRLRKLIGDADAIVQQGGALSLDKARVWVDVWVFEDLLARSDTDATKPLRAICAASTPTRSSSSSIRGSCAAIEPSNVAAKPSARTSGLKRMLSISLGVQPSAQTERLYQSLKREAVG